MKRIFSRLLPCVAALALSMASTSALAADPVEVAYVVGGGGGTEHSTLWRITDLSTGEVAPVAMISADLHAMAVDDNGYIWAASTHYDGNPFLYRINPVTGKIDFTVQTDLNGTILDMTVIGTTLYAWDRNNSRLNTVNVTTGARTAAASTITNYVAISVDTDGTTLRGTTDSNFYTINTGTGAADTTTAITTYPDFAYGQMRGGEIAADGDFYFVEGHSSKQLVKLDMDTQTAVFVGSLPATAQSVGIRGVNDTDGDGIPDIYETAWGLATSSNDAAGDEDGDGLSNLAEFQNGTSAILADTDNDGLNDGDEIAAGTDPHNPNSDADSVNDGAEVLLGSDPLDGVPDNFVIFTDDDADDFHSIASAQDADGNYHIVITQYDDTELTNVPYYAMVREDGGLLIAPSVIATSAQVYDDFSGVQVLPKPDGTVAIVARTDRYTSYMLIDPSADDQNGDGVDISTNTDFVLRDPTDLLQTNGGSDIYNYHPFAFLDGNDLYLLWENNNSSDIITLSKYDADGINLSDVEIFGGDYLGDYRNDFSVALDGNGVAHVVMSSDDFTDNNEVYYFAMELDGTILIQPAKLTGNDDAPSMRPEIVSIGSDRYVVAWADKGYRHPDDPSYIGGDIMMTVLNLSGVTMDGGSVDAEDIMELPATLITKFNPGWYFDLEADGNGGARILFAYSRGGSYSYGYATSVAMQYVSGTGPMGNARTLATFGNFGERYHFSGDMAGDSMVYGDIDGDIVLAKLSASSTAPLTSSLNATLSKGSFLYLEDVAQADLGSAESGALPSDYDFNDGFVRFAIGGIDVGDTVNVTLDVSDVPNGATYFKWDGSAWNAFPFVDLGSNQIQISLTDGGAGDLDGVANGVIVDPSGLGSPTFPVGDAVGVKGGGGGCVIDGKGPFDPTLPLLALLAAGYLVRRRFTVSQ